MVRRGKRVGLALGYALAVVGGIVAAWSVVADFFPALLLGGLLIGFANGSSQLSRYASAEMATPDRRAAAISMVVWAATVGAILGPASVPLSASVAEGLGMPELAGPFLLPAVFTALAAILLGWFLRPDPDELAVDTDVGLPPAQALKLEEGEARATSIAPMSQILRRPAVMIALTAMIVGQVVMIVIMAMTPLHMTDHGHGLDQ
jgi:MFS family permease